MDSRTCVLRLDRACNAPISQVAFSGIGEIKSSADANLEAETMAETMGATTATSSTSSAVAAGALVAAAEAASGGCGCGESRPFFPRVNDPPRFDSGLPFEPALAPLAGAPGANPAPAPGS